ncbi:MAG: choice-of-anchor tandem repeat GloVer-containing protein [Candidatus Sulfotelmatobacter sp.]
MAWLVFVFYVTTTITCSAQTLNDLVSFDLSDGADPVGALIQGIDGNFYGTPYFGGSQNGICAGLGCGTVVKITADGKVTNLHSFDTTDGGFPAGALVQTTDGNFYGTTSFYGAYGFGTVFKITPAGDLTTLYNFCSEPNCADGFEPEAGLIQAADGNLYGTTSGGGANNLGSIFRISITGKLTTIYSFAGPGVWPAGALVQAADGDFYGTTSDNGTVFKITPAGDLTTLYNFCSKPNCADGRNPQAGLIQATDGNFYGTTQGGGYSNYGTVFKITPRGKLTTLYSFCSQSECPDGAQPLASLVQATDGNFYGTTSAGGANPDYGTVFKITIGGTLTTLYNFCSQIECADGANPFGSLIQATNGTLYGTTRWGGVDGYGTVFDLAAGLGPFVEAIPASSKEGAKISILGQGFTSSSVVKFGGVRATSVELNGSTDLIATVPARALTGKITVTTSGTTLTSNVLFRVTPQVLSFSPPSGPVGTPVTISGIALRQTLGVGFGDYIPAMNVKVISDTSLTATVPTGAKTGPVGVETKGGIGVSSTTFTVTP